MTCNRTLVLALGVALAATLGGCAQTIRSDVARFHQLAKPQGETFRIQPADPGKAGSLEFATYARQVADRLSQLGYRPAAEGDAAAQLDVRLDYEVSAGREKLETRSGTHSPYFGGGYWSNWSSPYWGNRYGPWGGWGWDYPEVYSYTVYERKLSMTIAEAQGGRKLFEGTVESVGKDNRLPEVMPYLVQSMFTDFPGQSGSTRHVKIELPSKR